MKKIIGIILSLILAGAGISAQTKERPKPPVVVKESAVKLSKEEVNSILQLLDTKKDVLKQTKADLDLNRANIERELVNKEVNMAKIKELIKTGLVSEEVLRITEIELFIGIRKIIGEDKWTIFLKEVRQNGKDGRLEAVEKILQGQKQEKKK